MKHEQPANAIPKILAFAQGEPAQTILLFIPKFEISWEQKMRQVENAIFISTKRQWNLPYSIKNIQKLESIFGKDILFAFMVGNHLGNHKTDI